MNDLDRRKQASYLLPDPGGQVVRECLKEIEELRARAEQAEAAISGVMDDDHRPNTALTEPPPTQPDAASDIIAQLKTVKKTRPPVPFDAEVQWILGRPCFWCGPVATVLRVNGHDIERKAEAEQAAVIYWMLELYAQHGSDWRKKATTDLGLPDATHGT